ncbi:hypothetical protein [Kordiimonas sp.]|uniref:hypothetical protein n=1 Tax=Kordiimonas sp. TaxID=1970157 RepID=UPI003A952372
MAHKRKKYIQKPLKITTVVAKHFSFTLHPVVQGHLRALVDNDPPPSWLFKDFNLLQSVIIEKPICVARKPKISEARPTVVPYFSGFSIARLLDFVPVDFMDRLQISLAIYPSASDDRIRSIATADAVAQAIFNTTATTPIKALFMRKDAPSKPHLTIPTAFGDNTEVD